MSLTARRGADVFTVRFPSQLALPRWLIPTAKHVPSGTKTLTLLNSYSSIVLYLLKINLIILQIKRDCLMNWIKKLYKVYKIIIFLQWKSFSLSCCNLWSYSWTPVYNGRNSKYSVAKRTLSCKASPPLSSQNTYGRTPLNVNTHNNKFIWKKLGKNYVCRNEYWWIVIILLYQSLCQNPWFYWAHEMPNITLCLGIFRSRVLGIFFSYNKRSCSSSSSPTWTNAA